MTAIQLRQDSRLYCKLLYGKPDEVRRNVKGDVAIFHRDTVVAYFMAWGERKRHIYVFRSRKGSEKINGVYPEITLLMEAKTRTRIGRVRRLLEWLPDHGYDIESLSDDTYARLQSLVEGKKMLIRDIKKVLQNELYKTI